MTNHVDTATPQELADTQTTAQELADTQTTTQDAQSKGEKQIATPENNSTDNTTNSQNKVFSQSGIIAFSVLCFFMVLFFGSFGYVWRDFFSNGQTLPIDTKFLTQLATAITWVCLTVPVLIFIDNVPEKGLYRFLDLDKSRPVNYPLISGFIQEQTVGGFGATIVSMFLKAHKGGFNLYVSAGVVVIFHLLLFYLVISYVRFIFPMTTNANGQPVDKRWFYLGAVVSLIAMGCTQYVVFSAAGFLF